MTAYRADQLPQDAELAYGLGSTTGAGAWSDDAVIRRSREGGVRLARPGSGSLSVERRAGAGSPIPSPANTAGRARRKKARRAFGMPNLLHSDTEGG